ncbi:hypothetical protein FQA39_LY05168 [Lamprigera yunnana]|nr:hypothetical protein FQA39_LY05168 [Lamprigera yunnana]
MKSLNECLRPNSDADHQSSIIELHIYRYLYNTDQDSTNQDPDLFFKLLNENHNIYKRAADQDVQTTTASNTTTTIVTTTKPLLKAEVVKKSDVTKKPTLAMKGNLTTVSKQLEKNVGENGTGIRKNITEVIPSTPLASSQKPPLDDHLIVPITNHKHEESESNESIAEISIDKFSEDEDSNIFNKTLIHHNVSETKMDSHIYYNSTFSVDPDLVTQYWVNTENNNDLRIKSLLSNAYRRAATVKLSFDFPFYGHIVRNVTIATGGFIYMGEYVHSWLAATQYIAPLMANFDTGLSNNSFIKYVDDGNSFTVQWERVYLQDKQSHGEFTFQTTLMKNGDIIFVYKNVPVIVEQIIDDQHPVKVGLSDAYLIDETMYYVRRKTIYEYHRVNISKDGIKNNTVIYLKALPTCLNSKDCHTCLSTQIDNFQCAWCPSINLCSSGLDRHRQNWLAKDCEKKQITNDTLCMQVSVLDDLNRHVENKSFYNTDKHLDEKVPPSLIPPNGMNTANSANNTQYSKVASKQPEILSDTMQASRTSQNSRMYESKNDVKMGASGIITILFLVGIISGLGVWVLYAYRNPHTTSGQILIRVSPTLLSLKKNVRRSSNLDNSCLIKLPEHLVMIESSTESVDTIDPKDCANIDSTVILISDSDEDKPKAKDLHRSSHLSKSQFVKIVDWVETVNSERNFLTPVKTETDSQTKAVTENTLFNFENVLSSLPNCDVFNDGKSESCSSSKSDLSYDSNSSHVKILNELYSPAWKNFKNVLPKSTPRRKKPSLKILSKTELKAEVSNKQTQSKTLDSPWVKSLKNLCDSDTSDNDEMSEVIKATAKLDFNFEKELSDFSLLKINGSNSDLDNLRDLPINNIYKKTVNTGIETKFEGTILKTKDTNVKNNIKTVVQKKIKSNIKKKPKNNDDDTKKELHSLNRGGSSSWKSISSTTKGNDGLVKSFLASLSRSVKLSQCDPQAKLFRNNFKMYKDELLNRLFKLYNENIFDNKIPDQTVFEWNDRMRGTAGFCYCRKITRSTGIIERGARIVLSTKVVDSSDRLRDTLIHELCHAATWIINQVANGHGEYWKAWLATKVSQRFPELPPIKRCHDYIINTKYTYKCMDCGYSIGRHSKSLDIERKRCGHCYGKFEVLINKVNKDGETKSVPVTPKKAPSAFALFVKENYATCKTPQLNHAQVMKLLGQKFSEVKVSL